MPAWPPRDRTTGVQVESTLQQVGMKSKTSAGLCNACYNRVAKKCGMAKSRFCMLQHFHFQSINLEFTAKSKLRQDLPRCLSAFVAWQGEHSHISSLWNARKA